MDGPLRDLGEWSGRRLTRRPMGIHLMPMGAVNRKGDLMMERLFLLGLGWIEMEGEGHRAFNISHGDGLLRTRLMHRNWGGSTFPVGRVWHGHSHRGAKWRDPNGGTCLLYTSPSPRD